MQGDSSTWVFPQASHEAGATPAPCNDIRREVGRIRTWISPMIQCIDTPCFIPFRRWVRFPPAAPMQHKTGRTRFNKQNQTTQTVGGFNSRLLQTRDARSGTYPFLPSGSTPVHRTLAIHHNDASEVMRKLNGRDARVAGELRILVPGRGKCPVCAARHAQDKPHNPHSLYYQIHFWQENGRMPTEADARAHCARPAGE